jgi:hypothetical protein
MWPYQLPVVIFLFILSSVLHLSRWMAAMPVLQGEWHVNSLCYDATCWHSYLQVHVELPAGFWYSQLNRTGYEFKKDSERSPSICFDLISTTTNEYKAKSKMNLPYGLSLIRHQAQSEDDLEWCASGSSFPWKPWLKTLTALCRDCISGLRLNMSHRCTFAGISSHYFRSLTDSSSSLI